MIDYGKYSFAAPPCTGEDWFITASQLAGYGPGFRHHAHEPWTGSDREQLRVSIVRRPVDFLKVVYSRLENAGISNGILFFAALHSDSFEEFAADYVEKMPGRITELYNKYKADVVLRVEDAPWSFIELAQSLNTDPTLVSTLRRLPVNRECGLAVPNWVAREIKETEADVYEAYDYW